MERRDGTPSSPVMPKACTLRATPDSPRSGIESPMIATEPAPTLCSSRARVCSSLGAIARYRRLTTREVGELARQ